MLLTLSIFLNIIFVCFKGFSKNNLSPLIAASFNPIILSLIAGFICNILPQFSHKKYIKQAEFISARFLTWALILLGAELSISDLSLISFETITNIFLAISLVTGFTLAGAYVLRIPISPAVWILVGNCICGPTAISFSYKFFAGDKSLLAKVIWINTMIGILLMLILPSIAQSINFDPELFGIWVGASLQSTAQVVTSASLYSPYSAEIALILKSVRIFMMFPFVLSLAIIFSIRKMGVLQKNWSFPSNNFPQRLVPLFMIGFFVTSILFNLSDFVANKFDVPDLYNSTILLLRLVASFSSSLFLSISMFGIGFLCTFKLSSSDYKIIVLSSCSAIVLVAVTFVMISSQV